MAIMGACISWILAFVTLIFFLGLPAFISSNVLFSNLFITFPILFFVLGIVLAMRD